MAQDCGGHGVRLAQRVHTTRQGAAACESASSVDCHCFSLSVYGILYTVESGWQQRPSAFIVQGSYKPNRMAVRIRQNPWLTGTRDNRFVLRHGQFLLCAGGGVLGPASCVEPISVHQGIFLHGVPLFLPAISQAAWAFDPFVHGRPPVAGTIKGGLLSRCHSAIHKYCGLIYFWLHAARLEVHRTAIATLLARGSLLLLAPFLCHFIFQRAERRRRTCK